MKSQSSQTTPSSEKPAASSTSTATKPTAKKPGKKVSAVKPPAPKAHRARRHLILFFSFFLVVVAPALTVAGYLILRAQDQYASTLGFIVRKEELSSAVEILGGLTQLSGSSSSDTDILYEFIQSQQLVRQIDERMDLRTQFSQHHEIDPIFSFDPDGTIEDLVDYWSRMVKIYYDTGSGLIELQAKAFDPQEAQDVALAIFEDSSAMINELSAIARQDATRYTREELEQSVERLKDAREAMAQFRSRTRIVDPQADIQGQMGLLNNLQQQLANVLIEADLLAETTSSNDPRVTQSERRIEVIRNRIAEERSKFALGTQSDSEEDYVRILSEFERLSVDREFAEQAYIAALSAFDSALAEAQRKSRYLAAYIEPTLPEKSQYPARLTIWALTTLFLLLIWAVGALVIYSIKDRR
ncbi:MAG: sugar transporter, partial [Pseudomonadota bacterium]